MAVVRYCAGWRFALTFGTFGVTSSADLPHPPLFVLRGTQKVVGFTLRNHNGRAVNTAIWACAGCYVPNYVVVCCYYIGIPCFE